MENAFVIRLHLCLWFSFTAAAFMTTRKPNLIFELGHEGSGRFLLPLPFTLLFCSVYFPSCLCEFLLSCRSALRLSPAETRLTVYSIVFELGQEGLLTTLRFETSSEKLAKRTTMTKSSSREIFPSWASKRRTNMSIHANS